jgi:hypothetical protein
VNGLKSLRRPEDVARIRGKAVEDILFPREKDEDEMTTATAPVSEETAPADSTDDEAADNASS